MNDFVASSLYWGALVSLAGYFGGVFLKSKIRSPLMNPLLVASLLTMVVLGVFHLDYADYVKSARVLTWFLTPATVCLAIPLYEKLKILKQCPLAILAGILAGILTNVLCVFVLALCFRLNHAQYVSFLSKSVTLAIGLGISAELKGVETLTIAIITMTGIGGNIMAETVCRCMKIRNRVARGVAIGTASHAIGTAKAMELGKLEGAISSLSLVVAGVMTVLTANLASTLL